MRSFAFRVLAIVGALGGIWNCGDDEQAKSANSSGTIGGDGGALEDGASPTEDGAVDAVSPQLPFLPSKSVFVRIGSVLRSSTNPNAPYTEGIYIATPSSGPDQVSAYCETQSVTGCWSRSCPPGDAAPPMGFVDYTPLLKGTFTITNETAAQKRDAGAGATVSFDVSLMTPVQGQIGRPLGGFIKPGDDVHIAWTGVTGLPPVDVRLKMPQPLAGVAYEAAPVPLSPTTPVRLAWIGDPGSRALVRVRPLNQPAGQGVTYGYCQFDRAQTGAGEIPVPFVVSLGMCPAKLLYQDAAPFGGAEAGFLDGSYAYDPLIRVMETSAYAQQEVPGNPVSVVVGLIAGTEAQGATCVP